ncbi:autophagy-type protein 22 [Kockovaella imperatae]|uniref:Autophagy-related protein n=1 Tax=Kockovaella imperatae TaxID=4999 RepID=A0A1Y1UMA7_9TREE|nr:autophagy-type protein 22 [Kockovaella imperatae]ORX39183.1 autophagy-type protein 22 [Kockovaella imperatae]
MKSANRHVLSWYSYAAAAEVFAACGMAIFLPITLEKMARDVGNVWPELRVPCTGVQAPDGAVCKARILGKWVDTASFSMYVKSIAVAVQALAIISIGPLADSPYWRKRLLITFALAGSASAIAFFLFPSDIRGWVPVIAACLTVVGNTGYGTSIVCANAFLPSLARGVARDDGRENAAETESLLPDPINDAILSTSAADLAAAEVSVPRLPISLATSRISSLGVAIGCFTSFAVLALLTIPVTVGQGSVKSLSLAIGISGTWWAVFTLPAWIGLPGRPTEDDVQNTTQTGRWLSIAWRRVGNMIRWREVKRLPNLYFLLFAWVFLADGFHTTTYTAILYASSSLRMSPSQIIIIGLAVQFFAVISSVLAPRFQKRIGYSNLRLLIVIVILAQILPLYACLGLLIPYGGLRSPAEMYVAAAWFGFLYGPFNSYSRAVYAELIPPGHESSFFSLFSLTDKSASFAGPFVVGLIADKTGNIRLGFLFLAAMLAVPIPLLLGVDVEDGIAEGRSWSGVDAVEHTESVEADV